MELHISCLCRGDYRNYFLVELPGASSAEKVVAAASLKGSDAPLPVMTLPFKEDPSGNSFVLVTPDADGRDLTLMLFAFDQQGAVLAEASKELPYSQIKWQSRTNHVKQRSLCGLIRGYDMTHPADSLSVDFIDCIQDADNGEDIVRSVVVSRWQDDDLQIRWLNIDGTPYDAKTLPMGVNMRKSPRETESWGSEAIFSSRMKRPETPLVVVLSSKHQPENTLFVAYGPERHQALLGRMFDTIRNAETDPYYQEWFNLHKADAISLEHQRSVKFDEEPLFSIVVPLFKTPLNLLDEMIDSVVAQSYPRWELLLVNASPEDQALTQRVAERAAADERLKVITLEANGGISINTNAGVAAAPGDFVCFFDHDDLLEPDCLYEYARAINANPETDVLYCDEDKLLDNGVLTNPYFKGDFNLDLLRSSNYICHLMTIRASLLRTLPPFSKEYDGAQDHAMVLQAVEKARHVHHVPRILYHWRAAAGSTAADSSNKPYATQAGIRAVSDHLKRMGVKAQVEQAARPFTYRVKYAVPEDNPLVSIIIPSKNHQPVLKTCLDSIFAKSTYSNYEIVVVDNGSTDADTLAYYQELAGEKGESFRVTSYPHPFNFSAMINQGVREAKGDYLILLNNDTEVITPDWIEEMLGNCARSEVGAVGVRLFYQDGTIQHAGGFVADGKAWHSFVNLPRGYWGYFNLADHPQDVSLVTAACVMVCRSAFESVGGFTEEMAVEYNDVDFCLKLREAGYLIVYTPYAELTHFESLSRGRNDDMNQWIRSHKETAYLNMRWAEVFTKGDPYLNPNFNQAGMKLIYRGF